MKRLEFIKTYYKTTNRPFSDHMIWDAEDRETAWRKGQHHTSKAGRTLFIVLQYLLPLCCLIPLIFDTNNQLYIVGIVLFLLLSAITDFSILKIEILYRIYRRDNLYSNLLYRSFTGDLDEFWGLLKADTKKYISGYIRHCNGKFAAKYSVCFRKRGHDATLLFRPNCVIVKCNAVKHRIDDPKLSAVDLANAIASILVKEIQSSNV